MEIYAFIASIDNLVSREKSVTREILPAVAGYRIISGETSELLPMLEEYFIGGRYFDLHTFICKRP
jgi:hypothetical protein